jgi:hypothetical protein
MFDGFAASSDTFMWREVAPTPNSLWVGLLNEDGEVRAEGYSRKWVVPDGNSVARVRWQDDVKWDGDVLVGWVAWSPELNTELRGGLGRCMVRSGDQLDFELRLFDFP